MTKHKPKTNPLNFRVKLSLPDLEAIMRMAQNYGIDPNERGWRGDLLKRLAQEQREKETMKIAEGLY